MAINAYGMPEGYDQDANPGARPRRPRPQGGFAQPAPTGASSPAPTDTAWGTTPTKPYQPQVPTEQYTPPQQTQQAPSAPAAPSQPSGSFASRYPSIVEAYRKFLGREPSEAEIAGQTGNGSFAPNDPRINSSIGNIQWSAEAQARTQPAAQPAPAAPAPGTPAAPSRTAANNPGLDPAKWASGHQSPKYAFHAAAQMFDQKTEAGRAQTLAYLQQTAPQWFNGWTIAGDKLRYGGDPGQLDAKWDGYNEFDAWRGSKAGEWGAQWMPTQRNGQAYIDPAVAAQQQAAKQQAAQAAQQQYQHQQATISQDTYRPGVMPQMPGVPRESQGVVPPQPTLQPGQMTYGGQDNDRRTYEPLMALPEWNQPDFGEQEQAQLAALMGVLQNPGIPEQQRAQMLERQKEQLMAGRDAGKSQVQENYLRRGLRGGALGAAERRLDDQFNSDLTRSSRDIEIANAGMRTSDVLNASQGLSSAMGGQFDRANTGFATALNRTLAGEGLRGASADSYRAVYNDDVNSAFNNANFGEQMRQFDLSQQLAMKNFLENQRQYDSGMGFNYAQMQQNYNLALMRSLGLA